jgi:hypothetical protein
MQSGAGRNVVQVFRRAAGGSDVHRWSGVQLRRVESDGEFILPLKERLRLYPGKNGTDSVPRTQPLRRSPSQPPNQYATFHGRSVTTLPPKLPSTRWGPFHPIRK